MKLLIAIDDTDNLQSRGTGYLARTLAERLVTLELAEVYGITRHQLLVHEDIPYTSHNSSACILAESNELKKIIYICRQFLLCESATGSDSGLCVAAYDAVDDGILNWGQRAKKEVLTMEMALTLAHSKSVYLEGLVGTHGGIIGALAAVGLRKGGNDGRFLWLKGMRKYMGVMSAAEVYNETGAEEIRCINGEIPSDSERIMLPEWWRPVLKDNKAVLFVEQNLESDFYGYQVISKDYLKRISN
jgi:hypothetical protein